jgi:hypothetical protein
VEGGDVGNGGGVGHIGKYHNRGGVDVGCGLLTLHQKGLLRVLRVRRYSLGFLWFPPPSPVQWRMDWLATLMICAAPADRVACWRWRGFCVFRSVGCWRGAWGSGRFRWCRGGSRFCLRNQAT